MNTRSDSETPELDSSLDAYARRAARTGSRKTPAELLGYTAAATGMAFAGGDAMAAVIHINAMPQNFSIGSSGFQAFDWDIDGAGGDDLQFRLNHFYTYSGGETSTTSGSVWAAVSGGLPGRALMSGGFPANLIFGQLIGAAGAFGIGTLYSISTFSGVPSSFVGNFSNTSSGYLGFRFTGSTGVPGTQYGWARIHLALFPGEDGGATLTISEWAFENCGDSITAGQTSGLGSCDPTGTPAPSPATPLLALLGLGAMGIRRYRERRHAALERLAGEPAPA